MPIITEGELRAVVAGLSRPETWPGRVALARDLLDARRERDALRAERDDLHRALDVLRDEMDRLRQENDRLHEGMRRALAQADAVRKDLVGQTFTISRLRGVLKTIANMDAQRTGALSDCQTWAEDALKETP